jgi:site-specific DNA-methyltransferase (adenine-specific)
VTARPVAEAIAKGPVRLIHGDALELGRHVAASSAELAYLDPPFAVGKAFLARALPNAKGRVAYDDRWPSLEAYLAWLEPRIAVVRGLLSPQGTLWLHLDQRAVHEAKCLCDRLFGRNAFIGEVIWVPGNGSKARRGPGMSHQTLLLYAAGKEFIWNGRDPALRAPFATTSLAMHFTQADDQGRTYRDRTVGKKTYRYYADEGRALGSVWSDCPSMVANTPLLKEGTGYPTQKPLKLLERIVRASTSRRGLVLDPFCGSGTTLEAASTLGRPSVGGDIGRLAIDTSTKRLRDAGSEVE